MSVDGWGLIYDGIRRWSRTVKSPGAIEDDSIADACNKGLQIVDNLVIESGQPWAVRSKLIADVTGNLGVDVELKTRRLFIEQDLGITDLCKVNRLWRVDPSNQVMSKPIFHCDQIGPENLEHGNWMNRWGDERWREDGEFNSSGNYDSSILLYNWGTALAGGSLKVTYWFTPATITSSIFTDVDSNGDRLARPPLPRKLWPFIEEYAKLVLLETMGDAYKTSGIWTRWNGRSGLEAQCRMLVGAFQLGEPTNVHDVFADEVNNG